MCSYWPIEHLLTQDSHLLAVTKDGISSIYLANKFSSTPASDGKALCDELYAELAETLVSEINLEKRNLEVQLNVPVIPPPVEKCERVVMVDFDEWDDLWNKESVLSEREKELLEEEFPRLSDSIRSLLSSMGKDDDKLGVVDADFEFEWMEGPSLKLSIIIPRASRLVDPETISRIQPILNRFQSAFCVSLCDSDFAFKIAIGRTGVSAYAEDEHKLLQFGLSSDTPK